MSNSMRGGGGRGKGTLGPGLAPVLPVAGHSGLSALDLPYLALNCAASLFGCLGSFILLAEEFS